MTIDVSIVEDDPGVRAILIDWISRAEGFRLVSEYSNIRDAVARLANDAPAVALVDINLSGDSGIELVRRMKPLLPATEFVMVTVFEDNEHIFSALAAGAAGYLLKRTPREELLSAIRQVHGGGSPMTSYIARKVVSYFQKQKEEPSASDSLSAREKEILRLLAQGYAYKEMAEALGISMGTINTHIRRIYHKLHVQSRGEAVALFAKIRDSRD